MFIDENETIGRPEKVAGYHHQRLNIYHANSAISVDLKRNETQINQINVKHCFYYIIDLLNMPVCIILMTVTLLYHHGLNGVYLKLTGGILEPLDLAAGGV